VSKTYLVVNADATYAVTIKASGQTGTSVAAGERAMIYFNGTDNIKVTSSVVSNLVGVLPVANGGTNSSTAPTNGGVVYGTASAMAYSAAGTSGQILTSAGAAAPTWTAVTGTGSVVLGTSPTISGATLTGVNTIQGLTVGLGGNSVSGNTAFGENALLSNSTGTSNLAVGNGAGQLIQSATSCTAIGWGALSNNVSSSSNTAVGNSSLNNTTGANNTAVGQGAGSAITTGAKNTLIGMYSGFIAPISETGSNWIVLSDGDSNIRQVIDSAGNATFGTGAVVVYAPAPASITTTATLTNANLQAQLISTTGTSYTVTMPTGTTLNTLVTWYKVDVGYDFSVINTASGTITMAVNTGVTSLGALTITTGTSARFRIRRTAASTYVLYRIS
jgi:hypothetical protein